MEPNAPSHAQKRYDFFAFETPAHGTISVPGSKSINNRALLLAALADGRSRLVGALDSDDTHYFAAALRALGFDVTHDGPNGTFDVVGCGGNFPPVPNGAADLFIGNAGTAARFLLAMAPLVKAPVRFDGVAAMRVRPMADLLGLLEAQGASLTYEGNTGFFPLTIMGATDGAGLTGGPLSLDPERSSQQVSAALMVAPFADKDTIITLTGKIVSEPYIAMTIAMMADWGVQVERPEPQLLKVAAGQRYRAQSTYQVEPDASSASYFFAAAALTGGSVTVRGLSHQALQGDVGFVDCLEKMGATIAQSPIGLTVTGPKDGLKGAELEMNAISDTAPTLVAIATYASGPVTITGVEHMRWKETDRIAAMATELKKMGADLDETRDGFVVRPAALHHAEVATYDDHRMAMSLAIAGLGVQGKGPAVTILDPACTSKTFPDFFERLEDLRAQSVAAAAKI